MNLYAYGGNSPANCIDPSGAVYYGILDRDHELSDSSKVSFAIFNDDDTIDSVYYFDSLDALTDWMKDFGEYKTEDWRQSDLIYELAQGEDLVYWDIMTLVWLNYEDKGYKSRLEDLALHGGAVDYNPGNTTPGSGGIVVNYGGTGYFMYGGTQKWHRFPAWAILAHELGHAVFGFDGNPNNGNEIDAMTAENVIRYALYKKVPGFGKGEDFEMRPRPAYGNTAATQQTPDISWETYWSYPEGYPFADF